MSTRLFVALVTTTVLAIALVVLSMATYVVLVYSLHAQLDQGLTAESQLLSEYFLVSEESPLANNTQLVSTTPYEAVAPSGSIFMLFGENGRVLVQSIGSLSKPLHHSAFGTSGQRPQVLSFETVKYASSRYRVISLPLLLPAQTEGVLQIARPLAPVEQTLEYLRIVLIAGTGVSLLFAVGLGLLLAHIAANPIENVASAMARIRAFGKEDERLAQQGRLQEPNWLAQSLNVLLDRVEFAEDTVGKTSMFPAQCASYVQGQLQRLILHQRRLNHFLRTDLRPRNPSALELPPGQRRTLRAFLQKEPRSWVAEYDEVVAWLDTQTNALEQWVANLPLAIGEKKALGLECEMVSLAPLLFDICQERSVRHGNSLQLNCRLLCTPQLRVNRQDLHDGLVTLIDNACKPEPSGGIVTATLQCAKESVIITVTNPGASITAEELPHVFTQCMQAATSRDTSRLGLPFAHKIIVQHGGTLTVQSIEGKGSTFTARLPQERSGGL